MIDALRKRGGGAVSVLLVCTVTLGAGLALDVANGAAQRFWFGPGAFALIGASAALFCALAINVARMLLKKGQAKGGGDA